MVAVLRLLNPSGSLARAGYPARVQGPRRTV